jgi:hypothetical protein
VVGRLVHGLMPPITLNFLRWAAGLFHPAAAGPWVLRPDSPACGPTGGAIALLGLLGVGCYNALQYLALQTSTPINVTLVGRACRCGCWPWAPCSLAPRSRASNWLGAALSMAGVLRGAEPRGVGQLLALRLVTGRPVHAAGHGVLGLLQLAAGTHQRRARQRCVAIGRPS